MGMGSHRLLHQLGELGLHRRAPDVVALGLRVQVVRPEGVRQEHALLVQELRADVHVEDVLLVVELRDDPVDLGDLVAHRIAGHAAREDRQQQDLGVGKSLRISSTTAPTPSAISGPVFAPLLLVPIISMTALG